MQTTLATFFWATIIMLMIATFLPQKPSFRHIGKTYVSALLYADDTLSFIR